jgi:hypothetical protein
VSRRPGGARRWSIRCLAVASLVGFLGPGAVAKEQAVTRADVATPHVAQGLRGHALDGLKSGVSDLGSGSGLVPMTMVVLLLLWHVRRPAAVTIPALTAGSAVLEGVAKWVVARPRPNRAVYGLSSDHGFASVVFSER